MPRDRCRRCPHFIPPPACPTQPGLVGGSHIGHRLAVTCPGWLRPDASAVPTRSVPVDRALVPSPMQRRLSRRCGRDGRHGRELNLDRAPRDPDGAGNQPTGRDSGTTTVPNGRMRRGSVARDRRRHPSLGALPLRRARPAGAPPWRDWPIRRRGQEFTHPSGAVVGGGGPGGARGTADCCP